MELSYFIVGILFISIFDSFCQILNSLTHWITSVINAKIAKNNKIIAELSDEEDPETTPIGFAFKKEEDKE